MMTESLSPGKVKRHHARANKGLCFPRCVACSLFLLTTVIPLCGQTGRTSEVVNHAKKVVAPVGCMMRDAVTGKKFVHFRTMGTAFIVDGVGTFITPSHVVDDFLASPWKETCAAAIGFPSGGWKRENQDIRWFFFAASRCQINRRFDVAVCKTIDDLSRQQLITYETASISTDRPPDGTPVLFTGFPLQATDPISSSGLVAGFGSGDNYNTIIIDTNAWPGASGSPIYMLDGAVIGMITKTGVGAGSGLCYGVVGERLVNILASARENWAKEGEEKKQN